MLSFLREKRLFVPTLMTLGAMPVLLGLGFWQLERKAWKESLIAAIEERTKAEPSDLANAVSATYAPPYTDIGYEYVRVKARGRFHHAKERYYYAPDQQMGPGFHVYTPFEISGNGAVLFVNRGFIPEALKEREKRSAGLPDGDIEITGLLRAPGRQALFTPENDTKNNLWFWRDFSGMFASAFENTEQPYIPVFVDVEGEPPGGWPKGSATRLELPNRHLEYAITWFGLAGALLAVFLAYAVPRFRQS